MSDYRTIAVLGASGNVGRQVVLSLSTHPLATFLSLRVLTRHGSLNKLSFLPHGMDTSINPIAYGMPDTHSQLLHAPTGVDVVISAIGADSGLTAKDVKHVGRLPGFQAQDAVARAAKEAGVQVLVPAEYGYPTHASFFIVGKRLLLDLLRDDLKLPWPLV